MPTPVDRRTANLRLSWQRVVGDSLSVASIGPTGAAQALAVPVHHESPHADPDLTGDPKLAPPRAWIEVAWLEENAGRRGHSIVQVDCYVRVGPKGSASGDPHAVVVDDVADAFEELFSGVRPDGTYKGWIEVLDFSVTPLTPTAGENRACLFVYNPASESSWGQPTERRRYPTYDGIQRITLRYAMRLSTDATAGLAPWHL